MKSAEKIEPEADETQPDAVSQSLADLCFAVRALATAAQRTHPSPLTDDVLVLVERRIQAVADRIAKGK